MSKIHNFYRLSVIIGALPNTIANGQTADAVPLMADLNFIVNQVNANAAPLSNTALLNATNSFTQVQSGIAATAGSNFPIASQVQTWALNNLTSVVGTNTLTGNVALGMSAYTIGEVFGFQPAATNTGPVTININSIGAQNIVKGNAQSLASNDIQLNRDVLIRFDGSGTGFSLLNPSISVPLPGATNTLIRGKGDLLIGISSQTLGSFAAGLDGQALVANSSTLTGMTWGFPVLRSYLSGFGLTSTAGLSSTLTINPGQAADATNAVMMTNLASFIKTRAAWSPGSNGGGMDTGSVAASTAYHWHSIYNSTTGITDFLFSLSATAPTLPAGFTQSRRIASMKTDSNAAWVPFVQDGNYVRLLTSVLCTNDNNPGSQAVTTSLGFAIPTGVNFQALCNVNIFGTGAIQPNLLLSDLAASDETPSLAVAPLGTLFQATAVVNNTMEAVRIRTDKSAQIRYRLSTSDASINVRISVWGYEDTRGRDA